MEYLQEEDIKKAKENGINEKTLYNRFYKLKWDKEKAINTPVRKVKTRIKYDKKMIELAQKNGIKLGTFRKRVRDYGMDQYSAATIKVDERVYEYRDEEIYKLTKEDYEEALKNGISKHRLYQRYYIENWELDRAKKTPVKNIKKYGDFKKNLAIVFPNWEQLIQVSFETFRARVKRGMPVYEALTRSTDYNIHNNYKKRESKITKEHIKKAEENGIKLATLKNRVYVLKWSLEKATTEPINENHWSSKHHPNYGKKGKHEE